MSAGSRGRILFADDDVAVLKPTTTALMRAGFMVTAAASGHEALARLSEQGAYDLLLADIAMPGNAGLELAEWAVREALLPVVLITGYPSVATAVQALRAGVVDYITKPFDFDELFARLDMAIERGHAMRAVRSVREQADRLASTAASLQSILRGHPSSEPPAERPRLPTTDPLRHLPAEEVELLSPRERDVLRYLARGNQVADIARLLGLSSNTVRNHVKSLFIKLKVRSQVALLGKLAGHNEGS